MPSSHAVAAADTGAPPEATTPTSANCEAPVNMSSGANASRMIACPKTEGRIISRAAVATTDSRSSRSSVRP